MKMKKFLLSILCLALLLAVMTAGVWGVNRFASPLVEEHERLAAEAAAAAEKEKLGDSVLLFDRADPDHAELAVSAETVQKVYKDETKQVYTLSLSTFEGYTKDVPIDMTLIIDFEGKIVSLTVDGSGETKELTPEFLPSFEGQDSALAGVELVGGVTFSSSAIKNAVNDGFNTLIDNELFAAAEKSDEQLLQELVPMAYHGIVNKAGVIQGEELEGSGSATGGYAAANGSGCLWFVDKGEKLLAVYTHVGGVTLYNPMSEIVTDSADPALIEEIETISTACIGERDTEVPKALLKLLPEEAEPVAVDIPGLTNCVVGAWTVETEEGTLYAFHARPYGYGNAAMDVYYVLDESGAISAMRIKEIFIEEDYFPNVPQLDKTAYRDGFLGLTADSYTGEAALIAGATLSSDAMETATRDVFEAFWLLTENRG